MKFSTAAISKAVLFLALFFLTHAVLSPVSAQTEKRIADIREIYRQTNEKIAESETAGETSSVYLLELIVNKNMGSYPAVGIYNSTAKFYYTFGDREKNPYPDRLLKISVTTNRAAVTENSEFLFSARGQLIFYFEKIGVLEKRLYFANENPIRQMIADKEFSIEKKDQEMIKTIIAEKNKLVGIFKSALDL